MDKHSALYLLMNRWVRVKQNNKFIADYLKKEGFKEVAIYGMDKNADNIYSDINVVTSEEDLETVDAVIVTAIPFFMKLARSSRNNILSYIDDYFQKII